MSNKLSTTPPQNKHQLLRTLTLVQVLMIGFAYLQPLTLFDTFATVSHITHGHVPTSYIIALIAILFTALSYGLLVKRYPSAGSAYTYTQKTINPYIGFMVGWSSLMDYLLMPMINVLLAKIYLSTLMPSFPSWLVVVVFVLAMTLANLKSINIVARLNTIIVSFQLIAMVIFVILAIRGLLHTGSYHAFSIQPLFDKSAQIGSLLTGATILCFSFLGFDGISSLSEETKDAHKTIPRAIFLTALCGGILFIIVSYFIQSYFHSNYQFKNIEQSLPEIALVLGGALFQAVILYFTCITVFASGLASHAGVSRLLYVMGRDGIFPEKIFGHISARWRTPTFNVIFVGIFALSAITFKLDVALSLISFGALIAFTFVNLSVISQFYIKEKRNKTIKENIKYLLFPIFGTICVAAMWLSLDEDALIFGIIWAILGFMYLLFVTKLFKHVPPQFSNIEVIS